MSAKSAPPMSPHLHCSGRTALPEKPNRIAAALAVSKLGQVHSLSCTSYRAQTNTQPCCFPTLTPYHTTVLWGHSSSVFLPHLSVPCKHSIETHSEGPALSSSVHWLQLCSQDRTLWSVSVMYCGKGKIRLSSKIIASRWFLTEKPICTNGQEESGILLPAELQNHRMV